MGWWAIPEEREGLSEGLLGGLLGGVLTSGLLTLLVISGMARPVAIHGRKEVVKRREVEGKTDLLVGRYGFAVVLFHGDGDGSVAVSVKVGETETSIRGDEQAIELVVGEEVRIEASGEGHTPTIEVAYLTW